ncbi:AraC family transcriptional regulator [Vibrio algarum]|uniref:AraC family transcriptional regulator n=1 Tax=Vibrio algarum TaxID=3020714 RepID=A0ABT4YWI8_9VIBR|nr:AraC family transcriptional regulator [Vibrio sp. KJ40-1]MDB1125868.1 AraC family transcriptional regulator [Vibrio sp. KJ40-1]
MAKTVRDINQRFWAHQTIPHLTIRTTGDSTHSYKAHSHSELSIGIIESGSTRLSMPQGEIVLNRGDIILIEPNMVHACNPIGDRPRSYHMLYIDKEWCCKVLSKLYGYEVNQFSCDQNRLSQIESTINLPALISLLLNQEPQKVSSELDNGLFNILSRFCSPKYNRNNDNKLAYKVKNRLLQDITCTPSLDAISLELGRPKETLIRNFKSHFGITPKSFLNNHRIEKSKFLLRCGMSIVNVATEVGFSDQSQFHRVFVNYTASTPRQYQQLTSIFDNNS